jgi:hypothetical protein
MEGKTLWDLYRLNLCSFWQDGLFADSIKEIRQDFLNHS